MEQGAEILSESTYSLEQNSEGNRGWTNVCKQFADANIYQTWPYEAIRSGESNVSGVVIRNGSGVRGAAQARVVRVPAIGLEMAYMLGGPLWRVKDVPTDLDAFRKTVRALRTEYVRRRKSCVRLNPQPGEYEPEALRQILREEGYSARPGATLRKTILMDVRPSLEQLSDGLHQKWRYHLKKARKQNLELVEGEGEDLFEGFERIYAQMVDRKHLVGMTDISKLKLVQKDLTAGEKMRVVLCKSEGEICAGGICSGIGDTGIYLFGATNMRGTKTYGSYLVHWNMLQWIKERGCSWYDLNGINPVANPGGYQFKSQFSGDHGREVEAVGQFDAYPGVLTKMLVRLGDLFRAKLRTRSGAA